MKVVMVAEADLFWTKKFVENISIPLNHEIVIISPSNKTNCEFYKAKGVRVIQTYRDSFWFKIPKLRSILSRRRLTKIINDESPDVTQIQYVFPSLVSSVGKAKGKGNLILTYWGSDLLRTDNHTLIKLKKYILKASRIIVMSSQMEAKIRDLYQMDDKVSVIGMGVTTYQCIAGRINDKAKIKKELLGCNADKVSITIGYNADPMQQHDKVLDQLCCLPKEQKEKIHILLPMTYRKTNLEYITQLKTQLLQSGFTFTIFESFLSEEEISNLCISTDIFVNSQITDAASASVSEQLCSGSYVFSGDWLKYDALDELGIQYAKYTNFETLKEQISIMVSNNEVPFMENNFNIIKDLGGWTESRERWADVYQKIGNK